MTWNSYYGNYRTRKFEDIWTNEAEFNDDYIHSGLYADNNKLKPASVITLFYLLYGAYGGSHIASSNETQFKYQVFSKIFEYGPSWEKKLDIQSKLRALTDDELAAGSKQIFNKALNPGTEPTTEELDYISEQTTSKTTRGKLDSYTILVGLLEKDITKEFIDRFKPLFLQIVMPERPLWYENTIDEEENN